MTETTTAPRAEHAALVEGYFTGWNATDPTTRSAAIEATWTRDARSIDPVTDVSGHDQLAAMIAKHHQTYPGSSFRQRGGIDAHHNLVRWGWEMLDADGNVALDGIDVARVNDSGLIEHLVGFFGYYLPDTP